MKALTVSSLSFFTAVVVATLPPNSPIYIGEITTPSSKSQIAWLPSPTISKKGVSILGSAPFSLQIPASRTNGHKSENITNLEFTGYSSPAASLKKDGKVYANCAIGPDSIQLRDVSLAIVNDGGHVWRKWTCWVRDPNSDAKNENGMEVAEKPINNVAEPPPQFKGKGGVYQKWTCDEAGCKPEAQ